MIEQAVERSFAIVMTVALALLGTINWWHNGRVGLGVVESRPLEAQDKRVGAATTRQLLGLTVSWQRSFSFLATR
jgi:hypothetical protein